jgi:hypothetical protein
MLLPHGARTAPHQRRPSGTGNRPPCQKFGPKLLKRVKPHADGRLRPPQRPLRRQPLPTLRRQLGGRGGRVQVGPRPPPFQASHHTGQGLGNSIFYCQVSPLGKSARVVSGPQTGPAGPGPVCQVGRGLGWVRPPGPRPHSACTAIFHFLGKGPGEVVRVCVDFSPACSLRP